MSIRSSLFRVLLRDSLDFQSLKADIEEFIIAENVVFEALFAGLYDAEYFNNRALLVAYASAHAGVPATTVQQIFHVVELLVQARLNPETRDDNAEDWFEDLVTVGLINSNQRTRFLLLANRISAEIAPKSARLAARLSAEEGALPIWESLNATVELRGVNQTTFGSIEDVDTYQPSIEELIPIASINLGFDAGTYPEIYFQATKAQLELLLKGLLATIKDLEALESIASRLTGGQS